MIEFKNVSKIYDTGTEAVHNATFTIDKGEFAFLVGSSGSGKSTILNLMSKMYEADSGEVLIDGVNINKLNKQSLRNGISLVNQFPYIFDMTIKENILLGKQSASDEEIKKAIEMAYLDEFISTLKDGWNTQIGERGMLLDHSVIPNPDKKLWDSIL